MLLASAGLLATALILIAILILRRPRHRTSLRLITRASLLEPFSQCWNDRSTIRWAIGEYIDHAFRIDRDFGEEEMLLGKVYEMSSGQAGKAVTASYHAGKGQNDPLMLGAKYGRK